MLHSSVAVAGAVAGVGVGAAAEVMSPPTTTTHATIRVAMSALVPFLACGSVVRRSDSSSFALNFSARSVAETEVSAIPSD